MSSKFDQLLYLLTLSKSSKASFISEMKSSGISLDGDLIFLHFDIFSVDKVKRFQRWCHFVKVLDLESWEELPLLFPLLVWNQATKQSNHSPPDRSSATPRPPPAPGRCQQVPPAIRERLSNPDVNERSRLVHLQGQHLSPPPSLAHLHILM